MKLPPRLALALAALLGSVPALAAPAAAPVDVDPAMWVVKDPDTTIYLFGTVHALDGKQAWFNDEIRKAFDSADELVLEVITPDDPASLQPLIQKYGFNPTGPTLTSKLSPKNQAALAAALHKYGMPPTALDRFKPFFAALTLSSLEFEKMGMTRDSGAEAVLRQAALDEHKQVGAVETMEFQLSLFDALPEREQLALLEQSLAESDGGAESDDVTRLVGAWGTGDAEKVAAILRQADADSPGLYKLILTDRNRNWSGWIAERMKRPGTVFLAVGAGHLAGPDSVQRFLKERGIASARVPHRE